MVFKQSAVIIIKGRHKLACDAVWRLRAKDGRPLNKKEKEMKERKKDCLQTSAALLQLMKLQIAS